MQLATSGLVLRQVKVGEADQILTILTPDRGVVSASARGSLRLKSKLFSGCGLFCYSEFSLTFGRSSNFVDTALVKKVFHGLGRSVEGMALAAYFAEALIVLSPEPPEAEELLRLMLNSLYMISEGKRPLPLIKAIFEMRAMSLSGYMPRILACDQCGRYDGTDFYLDGGNFTYRDLHFVARYEDGGGAQGGPYALHVPSSFSVSSHSRSSRARAAALSSPACRRARTRDPASCSSSCRRTASTVSGVRVTSLLAPEREAMTPSSSRVR